MIKNVLWAEQLKLKRSFLPYVLVLVPLLVLGYELLNLTYRSEYVEKQAVLFKAKSMWEYLLFDNSILFGLGFPLAITIVASIIANIEHQSNAWKQTLTFPISRARIYIGKFIWLIIGLFFSLTIFLIGLILLGEMLGFDGEMPIKLLLGDSYLILVTSLPLISFQLWLSITFKNQAFSILIGTVCSMVGLFLAAGTSTRWFPLAYPVQTSTVILQYKGLGYNPDLSIYITVNLILGLLLLVIGLVHFSKRDVK